MPDAIAAARDLLEGRIKEIESEAVKLRSALQSLVDSNPQPSWPATKPKRRSTKRAAKRAPRGQRRQQVLAALKKSPGATAAELGKQIGISTNQAYALGQRLLKDGQLKKQGKGYALKS